MRRHFDLDPGLIYLNAGTHSICPRSVSEAAARYRRDFELNPTAKLFDIWERLWGIQGELGRFLGARPQDLFLRTNVTEALNAFLLGVPLPEGGEILTTDLEYGAIVNVCRFRAERDGRTLRTLELLPLLSGGDGDAAPDEARILDAIVSALRPSTRMLLISHVMTSNGWVIPLAKLARETRRRGVILAVDGAHGPGALSVDFSRLGDVDFYGGNLHKWVMGPKGTAFGWVAPWLQDSVSPLEAGWTTFDYPAPFRGFGEGSRFQGRLMLSACHDFSPFLALGETLEFWSRLGAEAIHARLSELQAFAREEASRVLGWRVLSAPPGPLAGPLLSFELPERLAALGYELMFRLLREEGLQIAVPPVGGRHCLRLSPHIHNSEEEIRRAVAVLARQ